ncbi:hypothetical protein FACS1894217_06680 [Clostridia bacterium]|nr:hypothetical protein FACS1894217_06680 [Clostridia bacterium]
MKNRDGMAVLIILAGAFLVGAIAGNWAIIAADPVPLAANLVGEPVQSSFFGNLLAYLIWPILIFLAGLSIIGVVAVPLMMAIKAFSVAYSVSATLCVFGVSGALVAFLTIGIANLIYIPALLIVSSVSVKSSIALKNGNTSPKLIPAYCVPFAICLPVFLVVAAAQTWLRPLIQNRF